MTLSCSFSSLSSFDISLKSWSTFRLFAGPNGTHKLHELPSFQSNTSNMCFSRVPTISLHNTKLQLKTDMTWFYPPPGMYPLYLQPWKLTEQSLIFSYLKTEAHRDIHIKTVWVMSTFLILFSDFMMNQQAVQTGKGRHQTQQQGILGPDPSIGGLCYFLFTNQRLKKVQFFEFNHKHYRSV